MTYQNIKKDIVSWFDNRMEYDNTSQVSTAELYQSYENFISPKVPLKRKTFVTNFKKTFESGISQDRIKFSYHDRISMVDGLKFKI